MRRYGKLEIMLAAALLGAAGASSAARAQAPQALATRVHVFDIPAKPLTQAINDIGRITGVSVALRENTPIRKTGNAVRGSMTVGQALKTLLAGSGLVYVATGPNAVAIIDPAARNVADGASMQGVLLEPIWVTSASQWMTFGGGDINDIGTTVVGEEAFRIQSGSSNDANSFLRAMPNVQYQNDSSRDAGVDGFNEIDTRPLQLTISGGKVYENNFRLNGIGINQMTGSRENFDTTLRAETQTPNVNAIFGLHPQTVFVPTEFIEKATVIDSNAPARYGDFLGGVVDYKMADPPKKKATGSISYGYQNDDMVSYKLGTEDGQNPENKSKPRFERYKTSASLGAPITDTWSVLAQYSRQGATSSKEKPYVLYNAPAEDRSHNDFYRLSTKLETDYGNFTLEGAHTDYSQIWDGFYYRDLKLDVKTKSLTSQLKWEKDFDWRFDPLNFGNAKATVTTFYNDSNTINDGGANETVYHTIWARSSTSNNNPATWFYSTDPNLLSWCRLPVTVSGLSATCRDGGYGYKEQGQTERGLQGELKSDLLLGSILFGGEYRRIRARRERDEYDLYATDNTLISTPVVSGFICPTGDPDCTYEQYAKGKTVLPAFSRQIDVDTANAYVEARQKWRWFDVRAGGRLDYESYFGNLNIAPRVTATYTPWDFISLTGGYNRYYNSNSVYYAVRDGQQIGYTLSRTHDASGVVGPWTGSTNVRAYNFSGSNLRTPYNDEYTAALQINEPLFGGQIRLRFIERHGHDQYLVSSASTSTALSLTNDGQSEYRAKIIEYTKSWSTYWLPHMNAMSLTATATWSKQKTTSQGYVDDDWDSRIWYNGRSYTYGEFSLVTGNLDIPTRTSLVLGTRWFNDALRIGVAGNLNLGYSGVRGTDTTCTPSATSSVCPLPVGSPGYGLSHDIFTDYKFDKRLTVDLTMQYIVPTKIGVTYKFDLMVDNVFNDTGNAIATTLNPWLRGRAIWLGASATF